MTAVERTIVGEPSILRDPHTVENVAEALRRTIGEIWVLLVEPAKRDDARTVFADVRDHSGLCVFPSGPNDGALERHHRRFPILEGEARPRIVGEQARLV